jgi:hypothetical protein
MSDDLNFDLDLTGDTSDDIEGGSAPNPGKYHVEVTKVRHVSDQTSYLEVTLHVLAGSDKAGVGRVFPERFYLSDGAIKRLKILGKRAKLIGDDDFGSRVSVDWRKLVGKHLVVEVAEQEYDGKNGKAKTNRVTWQGFYHPTDERVKDVPKDEAAIKAASSGKSGGKSGGTGKPKPPPAKDEDWGEI